MTNLKLNLTSEQTLNLKDLRQALENAMPDGANTETYAALQYGTCGGTCFFGCDSTCWPACTGHCDTTCTNGCQSGCTSCTGSCRSLISMANPFD